MNIRVLIMPDCPNWALDRVANGLVALFNNNYLKHTRTNIKVFKAYPGQVVDWKKYDVCYVMLPTDLPEDACTDKFCTTLHGGPGMEGQYSQFLQRNPNVRISYISQEITKRVELVSPWYTPQGIGMQDFCPVQGHRGWHEEKVLAGWSGWSWYLLGRQSAHRRGPWVISAQQELTFKLFVAGAMPGMERCNELFKEVHPGIETYALTPRVMLNFYNQINLYLVPDKRAGGPYPVLEAGACEVPVVTTKCGLCADFIVHGRHGLVVETYDEFVDAIKWMQQHPNKRRQMGTALRQDIMKYRTWYNVKHYWQDFLFAKYLK